MTPAGRAHAPDGAPNASDPCGALANNHVLDWGPSGLVETLDTLHAAGIRKAGAGKSRLEAEAPADLALASGGRISVAASPMG